MVSGLIANGSGTVSITKSGSGTWTLSNSNSYTGTTTVNGGVLVVNGSVVGPVVVNSGGTLQGTGSLGGLVTVAAGGTLAPGNRPGTINLGSLTLNSGAVTNIELAGTTPGTQFDHVNVTGQLALGGTLVVSLINNFTPQLGQTFDILDWPQGGLTGKFSAMQLPSLPAPQGWDTSQLYTTGALAVTATVRGDFNRDGQVTAADIPAMLAALSDLQTYAANNSLSPTQLVAIGDFDNSGTVSNRDLQGLLDLVGRRGGGSVAAVPEPSSMLLLGFGALAIAFRRRSR